MSEILETIFKRRSVRQFLDRPLEPETIHCLLQAAMAAPSACNSQPWEFIVVTDAAMLDGLRAKMQFARYNAPCAVVVCGSPHLGHNSAAKHFWVQDCSAAMENLLVTAAGMGLGAVWIGVHPLPSNEKRMRDLFNIPPEVTPLGVAMLGYPAEGAVPQPRTQFNEQRVHWQIYEPKKPRAKIKNAKFIE
jgi:nitroreductase